MPEVQGIDKLFSATPHKRFGLHRRYGTGQFGNSNYGEDDIFFLRTGYGDAGYGVDSYGDLILLSGIYRIVSSYGHRYSWRDNYYFPKNPRSDSQWVNRMKLDAGVAAWQSLTLEQWAVYNSKAVGRHMSGFNLFLKEFMAGFPRLYSTSQYGYSNYGEDDIFTP
jgi:hypothetical protein